LARHFRMTSHWRWPELSILRQKVASRKILC
jgi:hypothetical protein